VGCGVRRQQLWFRTVACTVSWLRRGGMSRKAKPSAMTKLFVTRLRSELLLIRPTGCLRLSPPSGEQVEAAAAEGRADGRLVLVSSLAPPLTLLRCAKLSLSPQAGRGVSDQMLAASRNSFIFNYLPPQKLICGIAQNMI